MAEVFGKTNLFPTGNYNQKKNLEGGACLVPKKISEFCSKHNSFPSLKGKSLASKSDFNGQRVVFLEKKSMSKRSFSQVPIKAQMQTGLINRAKKWWEKGLQPNMNEVSSAQGLVDSLLNAGDKLVVVDFFSPGCGGCKALHPKICQFEEMNPDVQFLQIKKFKDALAKHTPDRCSLGPTKGLEEKELLALSGNKALAFHYTPKPVQPTPVPTHELTSMPNQVPSHSKTKLPLSVPMTSLKQRDSEEKTLVGVGR